MSLANLTPTLSKWFNRQDWLDRFAKPVQSLVTQLFNNGGVVGKKIANFLNGTWLGHPLHSVITDVPVGAWTAAITLDAMEASTGRKGIGQAADAAVALGVASAASAAVAGFADWQHTTGESRRVGFTHALLNTLALGLYVSSMVARSSRQRSLGRALALAGFGVVSASAYLGGDLVYRLKVGIDHSPERSDIKADDYQAILPASNLPENQLYRAQLNDIPLVLLRRGERVYALAATCAHLGGPLNEGELQEDPQGQPVVVCPWHGSRFNMQTGAVLDGPSAYPEPCFDARIRNGQVEVRHQIV
ncbi:MAG: DUF2231 domain-containing protein [Chloroflexi bacterium]|nr:MAG: DUF2231 domain-containing protein [Chloroflexota bacterium]